MSGRAELLEKWTNLLIDFSLAVDRHKKIGLQAPIHDEASRRGPAGHMKQSHASTNGKLTDHDG